MPEHQPTHFAPIEYQMHIQSVVFACFASVLSFAAPCTAQRDPEPARIPVVVVMPEDYPAFAPRADQRRATPVRAVVIPRDRRHGNAGLVLLNPAFANPHTLYEALSILRRARHGDSRSPAYLVLPPAPSVREPSGPIAARLQTFLTALRSSSEVVRLQRTRGRAARLDDAWAFFPESAPRGR